MCEKIEMNDINKLTDRQTALKKKIENCLVGEFSTDVIKVFELIAEEMKNYRLNPHLQ